MRLLLIALLALAGAVVLVAARGAVRDWVILVVAAVHAAAGMPGPAAPGLAATAAWANAAAMAGVAAGALIGGAIDVGWAAVPWDAQVRGQNV